MGVRDLYSACRNAVVFTWDVLRSPLDYVKNGVFPHYFAGGNLYKEYVLPMAIVSMAATFIGYYIGFPLNAVSSQSAVVYAIFDFITLAATPMLAMPLLRLFLSRFCARDFDSRTLDVLMASLLAVPYAISVAEGLFPNMFFVKFGYIYMLYVAGVVSEQLLSLHDNQRNQFMVFASLVVAFMPWVILKFIKLLVPNLA